MIKLLILGPTGSMGKLISELALKDEEIDVVAACGIEQIGMSLGSIVAVTNNKNIKISDIEDLIEIIQETKPDVVVDFTVAKATEKNCLICAEMGIRCVIGTTALSEEFFSEFEKKLKENHVPAIISPNMATGMNVFFEIVKQSSQHLKDWDIEIIEAHHHRKIDAPSGTALKIGKVIGDAINSDFDKIAKYGRDKGPNKREIGAKNEIGLHSIRAGDIVGDHIVLYAGTGERIELKHQAHSRYCFAEGAIRAIKFISKKKEGKIYSTDEVLGLKSE
ncbi:MAG: 4-hydroxy-tetrahydrodipicolinate reductase [Promethearchaeota archaeon]|nr:MAG: 4-hydroxy-tetrahydrodipicolinate reductase [Candidatus Lokiarchaeota archaeon]